MIYTNYLRYKLFLMLSLMALTTKADESKIIIWFNDSSKMEVLFQKLPLFEYSDGNLTLRCKNTDITWSISHLSKFTIENATSTETEIHEIPLQKLNVKLECCEVYNLSGKKYPKKIRSLIELPKGSYIVKEGSITTKVVIR